MVYPLEFGRVLGCLFRLVEHVPVLVVIRIRVPMLLLLLRPVLRLRAVRRALLLLPLP
jgi:hypothetical protein